MKESLHFTEMDLLVLFILYLLFSSLFYTKNYLLAEDFTLQENKYLQSFQSQLALSLESLMLKMSQKGRSTFRDTSAIVGKCTLILTTYKSLSNFQESKV